MDNNSRQEAKRIGKILLRVAVTLLLIIITLIAAVSIAASYGFTAGLIAAVIGFFICSAVTKTMKKSGSDNISEDILPDILMQRIELKEYSASKHFDSSEIRRTGLLSGFTSVDGGAYIDGSVNGIHFVRCNIELTDRDTEEIYNPDTNSYEKVTSDNKVFSGYILRTEHQIPQYAGVKVCSDTANAPALYRNGEKLRSENGISVFSSVEENVPVTLTNGLSALVAETGDPAAAAVTDKYIYLAVCTNAPPFKGKAFRSIKANSEKFTAQTEQLVHIVEKLNFLDHVR